jgi:hypothetical protein
MNNNTLNYEYELDDYLWTEILDTNTLKDEYKEYLKNNNKKINSRSTQYKIKFQQIKNMVSNKITELIDIQRLNDKICTDFFRDLIFIFNMNKNKNRKLFSSLYKDI